MPDLADSPAAALAPHQLPVLCHHDDKSTTHAHVSQYDKE
jgi:hypothetical protein